MTLGEPGVPAWMWPTLSTAACGRRHVAADDALHRDDELRRHEGRIGAAIGHRAMPAGALEGDLPAVRCRQHGAGADREAALLEARHVVHAVDGVAVVSRTLGRRLSAAPRRDPPQPPGRWRARDGSDR